MDDESRDQRVLVLAVMGRDGALTCDLLRQSGHSAENCLDMEDLCCRIEQGVGAVVLAEEAIEREDVQPLIQTLEEQPTWSDPPLIILAASRSDRQGDWHCMTSLGKRANITLVERPVRPWAMVSAVQSALRARQRQYQVRDYIVRCQLAEEQLRRSEAILKDAGRMAQLGAWEIECKNVDDLIANEQRWSDQAFRIFGYEPHSVPASGELFFRHVPPEDRVRIIHAMKAAIARHSPYSVVHRIIRADGAKRIVQENARITFDEQGRPLHILGAIQDITEQKQLEEALAAAKLSAESAQLAAEEASRAKDRFLAMLSHELRTPLTPVVAAVSMLQQNPTGHTGETAELVELIRRNVELEKQLINDLLDMTRITRGKVELDRKEVDLSMVLHRAVAVCRPDTEAKKIDLKLDLGSDAPYVLSADPLRLQQVFWNLLHNAVKFTPQGGTINIRCHHDGRGNVVSEVSDTGLGIDPRALHHIFDPFEQGTRDTARQFGGLGLGLTICKSMVEMHGGHIEAHSAGKGKGATFLVTLPVLVFGREQTATHKLPSSDIPPTPPIRTRSQRILLVEDHGDTARIMRHLLTSAGHSVKHAGDVASAVAMVKADRNAFDLMVSDIGLPDGSGHQLMQALFAAGHCLPAIALSGYGAEADVRKSRESGFSIHLIKPANLNQLQAAIAIVSGEE